jgi:flagellar hook-associated protein 3 FlgL
MINRISTQLPTDDLQFQLRRHETELNRLQNQMGTQHRVLNLRDDPLAAAHAVRYQSYLDRVEQFQKNIASTINEYRVAEGYIQSVNQIVHRLTELAIQGANGTYTPEDLKYMGAEVNELLNELVNLANTYTADGNPLFSGDRYGNMSFRVREGRIPGAEGRLITGVDYIGTLAERQVEVMDNVIIGRNIPGNRLFWAEQQQVISVVDSQNFQVLNDTYIRIDGVEIPLRAGDNVHAVIAKINDADLSVKARLDPYTNGLSLQTTMPHQIWLEEPEGAGVLTALGLVREGVPPPGNFNPDARVLGGSLFDMAIRARDAFFSGDQEALGGHVLGGLRNGQANLLAYLADLGSKESRLNISSKTLDAMDLQYTERISQLLDLDMTQGIMDLKLMESVHQASLGAAGRIIQPRLMEFLR